MGCCGHRNNCNQENKEEELNAFQHTTEDPCTFIYDNDIINYHDHEERLKNYEDFQLNFTLDHYKNIMVD